ncbi:DoxX family protein [Virgibacillus sp. MSP4-1]|uniref:DoxX family protein n=1 Tax=Virgibacillus sp. MSP4-1 TaxID=2700081 RepID=UPI00039EB58D|nr:DoxX family protein [Virgibacillus sp. MSP4-1]QHS24251.1 DoxX family protein [Virgibacillus sp. MSP4-1]
MYRLSPLKMMSYVTAFVFLTSGIMKLINEDFGQHFIHMGLPYPLIMVKVIAVIEVIGAICFLAQKWVKLASIPLIFIMFGAIFLTKIPILETGFMSFLFEARLDLIMLALLWFLYNRYPQ